MKIIAIKNNNGGYTAYHSTFPSMITEAETIEEIKENLINIFHDIIMNSEIDVKEIKEKPNDRH